MAMDFVTSTAVHGGAPASTVTRTPDSDTDTPPTPHPHAHHHSHAPPSVVVVSYRECMKNHAASSGGHALDGCCEFMPGPTSNPMDPTTLTCAACGCHRNFHRRDPDDPAPITAARGVHSPPSASHLLLSLSGQSPSGPSDVEVDPRVAVYFNGHVSTTNITPNNNSRHKISKKRFRTRFSQEQKEKMHEFAGKIGWRLRRGEERLVEEFCRNAGVERGVFKVWMHNNKNNSGNSNNNMSSSRRSEKDHVDGDGDGDGDGNNGHHDHQQHHNHSINGGSSSNNGSSNCGGAVVYHEFYANNGHGGAQEAQ